MTAAAGSEARRIPPPAEVRRRDGSLIPFDVGRIEAAVEAALRESRREREGLAREVGERVVAELAPHGPGYVPGVEELQDLVEHCLGEIGLADVRDRYAAYRGQRAEQREEKGRLGIRDELKLTVNAVAVLRERYLLRDDAGRVTESTDEMMERVARHVAAAEDDLAAGSSRLWERQFAEALRALDFLPNSPTLMNAGTDVGLLSGCFVLPVEDSLDSIFAAVREMALVHQAGGGTGFSFSRLRPAGDLVRTTRGTASGPVSFMRVFDVATEVVKQGGRRRGANMAVLDASHPDIDDFVAAKQGATELANFNLSVGVSDEFMRAADEGLAWALVNPRNGERVATRDARELLGRIAQSAWRSGDPGLLFLDRINEANPVPRLGRIEATNPCGEVPLLAHESCNLGSINLARMVSGGALDWDRLAATARLAVRLLDDVIDANRYPTEETERMARRTRKIGVGVMGLAETLAVLGIPYDSEQAIDLGGQIARSVSDAARQASIELAAERGPFPAWELSELAARGMPPQRNAQLTSVAPTGTISIIAGTTAGIEPMFAISYARRALGRELTETNPAFERLARDRGFYSRELLGEIAATGGVRDNAAVPAPVREAFVTAHEVKPEWHLRMQAAFQRHTDAAVAKTVNLPAAAAVADVERIFVEAWRLGAKGVTVYRYGSKPDQALTFLGGTRGEPAPPVEAQPEYAGGCAAHTCEF